tara:strand:- start:281 stop:1369 length:1089 start_codon:yes stop_codon:yes gene_type:complete
MSIVTTLKPTIINMENKLKIAEPCHENWSEMKAMENGKHCAVCAKKVVDFSENSKEEIIDYLDNAEGQTCGRFKKIQIDLYGDRDSAIKKPAISLYKTIVASILAILGAGVPSAIAQGCEYLEMGEVAYDPIEAVVANHSNISIKGEISSHDQLVENAKVSIYADGKLINSVLTRADGKYVFEIGKGALVNNRFTVKVFAANLETKTIENLEATKTAITIDFSMEHEMMVMGKFMVQPEIIEVEKPIIEEQKIKVKADEIKYYKGNVCVLEKEVVKEPVSKDSVALTMKSVVLIEPLSSQIATSKTEDIEDVVLPEIANPIEVTVYPNPSSSRVFVRTNKNDTYQYGVIDLNGKLVFSGIKK